MRTRGKILGFVFLAALVLIPLSCFYVLFGGGRSFWDLRGAIDVIVFDPLARWVALGGRDVGTARYKDHGDVKLCDMKTGKVLHLVALPDRPWAMAINHNGTLLSTYAPMTGSSYDLTVFAIPADGTPVRAHEQTLNFPSKDAFGFVGRYLVCAGEKQLAVIDTTDWTVLNTVRSYTQSPALDPFSERIALGQESNGYPVVLCWNLGAGEPKQLTDAKLPLAFLPHDKLVAALSREPGGLALWPEMGAAPHQSLPDSTGEWSGVCVSKDGQSFAAWSGDGTVRVWKCDPRGATVVSRLSVPRVCYALPTSVADALALEVERRVTMKQRSDGGSEVASYDAGGAGLWSMSQGKRMVWFEDRDILIQGSLLAVYLRGAEIVSVWDVSNLVQPKLLWEDRWRHGGSLFE